MGTKKETAGHKTPPLWPFIAYFVTALGLAWAAVGVKYPAGARYKSGAKSTNADSAKGEISEEARAAKIALGKALDDEISAYVGMVWHSKKLVNVEGSESPLTLIVSAVKPTVLPKPEDFTFDKDGKCRGSSYAMFKATLFGLDKNQATILKKAFISLNFVCTPQGRLTSYDEWDIRDFVETSSRATPGKSKSPQDFCDNKRFHKPSRSRMIPAPKPCKHMHVKMRRAC